MRIESNGLLIRGLWVRVPRGPPSKRPGQRVCPSATPLRRPAVSSLTRTPDPATTADEGQTGRRMAYVACTIVSGKAYVADAEELGDIAWATPAQFDDYVPYGFAPMVQDYLADALD